MVTLLHFVSCNTLSKPTDDDYSEDVEFTEKTKPSDGDDTGGKSADCSGGGIRMGRGGGGQSQPIIIVTGGSGGSVPSTPPAEDPPADTGGSERRRRARRRRARLVRMAKKAARNARRSG